MNPSDLIRSRKVRHGPRDPNHPMEPARRQSHRRCCISEKLASRIIRRRDAIQQVAVGLGIRTHTRTIVPVCLQLARGGHPARDCGAAFGWWRKREIGRGHALHINMQIDAVEQRARSSRLIIHGAPGGAAAGKRRVPQMAAPTRVHGRDELHTRREGDVRIGPRNADIAGLEWLPKRIQNTALEFWQLVEEQNAEVSETDLTRPDAYSNARLATS